MTECEKNILKEARMSADGVGCLEDALEEVNSRLFNPRGARRFDADAKGAYNPTEREELLDCRRELMEKIKAAHSRSADVFIQAIGIIDRVENSKLRAVLRYYFLCGKNVGQIAKLTGCCCKTVQQYISFCRAS